MNEKLSLNKEVSIGDEYTEKIHKTGRISGSLALILIFLVPSLICLKFNIFPPMKALFKGIITIAMLEIPVCIAEVLTFTPMLGSGASYLAFVSGNLTNLKIPCASMPPKSTSLGMISDAVVKLEKNQLKTQISQPVKDMLNFIGPEMKLANRIIISNLWLFGPLFKKIFSSTHSGNALLRTTTAATMA